MSKLTFELIPYEYAPNPFTMVYAEEGHKSTVFITKRKEGQYFNLATPECGSFSFCLSPLSLPMAIWKVWLKLELKLIFCSQVAPAAWWDRGGQVGLKPGHSCAAGAEYTFAGDPEKKGLSCMWFTDNTQIKGDPTLKPALRTFSKVEAEAEQEIARNPWMAPGSAPVFSPCGVAGGS